MSHFDDLRREAERAINPKAVNEIEKQTGRVEKNQRALIEVDGVRFVPERHASEAAPARKEGRIAHFLDTRQNAAASNRVIPTQQDSPSGSASERLIGSAVQGEYSYAKLGLVLGLACIIGGIILGLNGVGGSTSWTAKVLGLESKINDAAPGVVLFIVGIFYVWITRPKVRMRDLTG